MSKYSKIINQPVPQTQRLHSGQVRNAAGGWGIEVNQWQQLHRFLLLGSTGGNYYFSERDLTRQNLEQIMVCIKQDGQRVVDEIVAIDLAGRAPKKSPALFVLALVMIHGTEPARQAAYGVLSQICRTAYSLFELLSEADGLKKGWGRGFKRAVQNWYTSKDQDQLVYQMIKYRQRNGYTHKDVLRLCHAKSDSPVLKWVVKGGEAPHSQIEAMEKLNAGGVSNTEAAKLIVDHRLPWEAVPSTYLNDKTVWKALVQNIPMTALVRNLGKITSIGLMDDTEVRGQVLSRLGNQEALRRARVHPISLMVAGKVYASGKGVKGSLTWTPNQRVVAALGQSVELAYGVLPKSDHPTLVAVDTSGSMWTPLRDYGNIMLPEVAACMLLAHAAMNPDTEFVMFNTSYKSLNVVGRRFDDIMLDMRQFNGGTDLNQAVYAAQATGSRAKLVTLYTDSETWAGKEHCDQAWDRYLAQQPEGRLVVASMTANRIAAHSRHPSVLQAVGFDTSLPQVVNAWAGNGVQTGDED